MSRYETRTDNQVARATLSGSKKRFNLELFLPLGGMIIVGVTSIILGALFYSPPERPDEPLGLPGLDEFERTRMHESAIEAPDAGLGQPDGGRPE